MEALSPVCVADAIGKGIELVAANGQIWVGIWGEAMAYACSRVFTESRGYWELSETAEDNSSFHGVARRLTATKVESRLLELAATSVR